MVHHNVSQFNSPVYADIESVVAALLPRGNQKGSLNLWTSLLMQHITIPWKKATWSMFDLEGSITWMSPRLPPNGWCGRTCLSLIATWYCSTIYSVHPRLLY